MLEDFHNVRGLKKKSLNLLSKNVQIPCYTVCMCATPSYYSVNQMVNSVLYKTLGLILVYCGICIFHSDINVLTVCESYFDDVRDAFVTQALHKSVNGVIQAWNQQGNLHTHNNSLFSVKH